MKTYSKISECGKYGVKPYEGTTGGQLWAWIDTYFAEHVGDLMDIDNFEIGIDVFEEEMRIIIAELEE